MAKVATPFKVVLVNGQEYEGRTIPLDIVAAERQFGGIKEQNRMQASFYAAFHALKRKGIEFESFESFLSQIDDYEEIQPGEANGGGPSGAPPSPASPSGPVSPPPHSSGPVTTPAT